MKEDGYPAADQYGGVLVIVLLITIIVKHRLHVTCLVYDLGDQ